MRPLAALLIFASLSPAGALAQDARTWLESQGLEATDVRPFQEFEAAVARPKGGAAGADERLVLLRQGKPVWTSNPKETDPGSRWTIHAIGRDLDGDGQPDLHVSSHSGGAHCCTTHLVIRLKPQVKRVAAYAAGNVGGGEFIDVPGRKAPVMISADDSSAHAFGPYANSYFPLTVLEVGSKGRLQFARDLMQTRLPGQPPPICTTPVASSNPWLKERCAEYTGSRRTERTAQAKSRLAAVKASRSADKLKWEDYFESGVLAAVAAEINRHTYTGHGHAGYNWLEQIWPGNDPVKLRFVNTLRQAQAKSVFAEDLKAIAADNR